MVRGVFFDAGNTVLFPDYDIYLGIARSLGADVLRGDVIRAEALARGEFERAVASAGMRGVYGFWPVFYTPFYERLGVPSDRIETAIEMTREVNDRDPGIWRVPVEGFGETMDALEARGIVAGIISNSDGRLERRLAQIGILDRFRFVIDSGVIGVSKPDPRIFEAAVERSSVPASQAAYVGDYYAVDVEGARAVGMKPVLFDPVGAYPDADCDVVRAFGEIVDLVDAWRSESTDPTA